MSRCLKLVYWDEPNFGDILSPYIVEALSGLPILHKFPVYRNRGLLGKPLLRYPLQIGYNLLHRRFSHLRQIQFPWQSCIVGVGSILSWGNSRAKIWGAGFMNESDRFHGGRVYALRGGIVK